MLSLFTWQDAQHRDMDIVQRVGGMPALHAVVEAIAATVHIRTHPFRHPIPHRVVQAVAAVVGEAVEAYNRAGPELVRFSFIRRKKCGR